MRKKIKKTKFTFYDLDTLSIDIFIVLFLFEAYSLVILNNPNISFNASILIASWLCLSILSVYNIYHNIICVYFILSIVSSQILFCCFFNGLTIMTFWGLNHNILFSCKVSLTILYQIF